MARGLCPPSGPAPVSAAGNSTTGVVEVTFDGPLDPASVVVPGQFVVYMVFKEYVVTSGAAAGNVLTLQTTPGETIVASPSVTYFAPPYNVLGANGGPVEQFVQFPLVVT